MYRRLINLFARNRLSEITFSEGKTCTEYCDEMIEYLENIFRILPINNEEKKILFKNINLFLETLENAINNLYEGKNPPTLGGHFERLFEKLKELTLDFKRDLTIFISTENNNFNKEETFLELIKRIKKYETQYLNSTHVPVKYK